MESNQSDANMNNINNINLNNGTLANAVSKLRNEAINKHNANLKELEKMYVQEIEGRLSQFSSQYNQLQLEFSSTLNEVGDMVNNNMNNGQSMDDATKLNEICNKLELAFNHAKSTVNSIQLPHQQSPYQMVHHICYILLCFFLFLSACT